MQFGQQLLFLLLHLGLEDVDTRIIVTECVARLIGLLVHELED